MSTDRLGHLARLRRPAAVIGFVAGLYALTAVPAGVLAFSENWRRPFETLTLWLFALLFGAFPLAALATTLAVRMERAATGVQHPQRFGWAGVSMGVFLTTHWASQLVWTPMLFFGALTSSYRREEQLVGAVVGLVAWFFAVAGFFIARVTLRRMRARDWTDLEPAEAPRRWISTPWLGAIGYGLALLPMSGGFGAFAVDEAPLIAVVVWGGAGLVAAGLGGAWGAWASDGMKHLSEPTRSGPRWLELSGAAWTAHWIPFWFIAASPLWSDWDHTEQLVASLLAAMAITVGTAAWSYGRAGRLAVA